MFYFQSEKLHNDPPVGGGYVVYIEDNNFITTKNIKIKVKLPNGKLEDIKVKRKGRFIVPKQIIEQHKDSINLVFFYREDSIAAQNVSKLDLMQASLWFNVGKFEKPYQFYMQYRKNINDYLYFYDEVLGKEGVQKFKQAEAENKSLYFIVTNFHKAHLYQCKYYLRE
ncbi:MAG: hypothetical protein JJT94_04565 [Bernardetiaceae bacterium]|nr:hypothetical protein [Bernardetiaceae bacterium]